MKIFFGGKRGQVVFFCHLSQQYALLKYLFSKFYLFRNVYFVSIFLYAVCFLEIPVFEVVVHNNMSMNIILSFFYN